MKALFLDRDGVINEDFKYVHKINNFKFKSGIFDLCRVANVRGYLVFIITNQAGIARGYYTERDFIKITKWMLNEFWRKECNISRVYYCPYHPDIGNSIYKRNSSFRKPNPGMILKAAKRFSIDLENSILVGDQNSDVQAGLNAGIRKNFLLLDRNRTNLKPHPLATIIRDLKEVIPFLV
ncbi:D-glycero-alpha-D-manno-heptose-1,7-bisphosphate 7-phosphatase [Leptospira vanthielii]|uniref:D,D-heptose 1,7-bisphosphate phosphatase n=1 Tax=Leptospira vanthielii serovar Holland str. Waz Holland = ATCC 700522 TaxID=1218591 RepID=N1W846_9LEPT|nr:HAD family hydrolase [Leptospira vanthielii]EMY69600.1 D,D-heptose 1,7-bisphosphate phosphatase [Leptospira vanthielii serovar Holland str. Waz Holland = ATCC 700522]